MSEEIKHYTIHWHGSPFPLMVGFGTGLFLPWAFMLQFNYTQPTAALVCLVIGGALTIAGGLGWASETIGVIDDENWSPSAMLMFIGTEIMTLGAILAGYWVARLGADVWPPAGTPEIGASGPLIATIILITSSITIGLARKREMEGNSSGFAMMVLLSAAIWVVFMVMTISDWSVLGSEGFTIGVNAYATALYGFTGIHIAHIVIGLLVMLTCVPSAFKGKLSFSYTRAMTMYVHFVNVLGIWVLLQIYYW
ncbi:MAG: hypothetical protein BMS9Abin18_0014 [Zetaproteobacteria bacterium]|nr:MAG: hypothetical protein BMS9Abin18_0014 [Zetaproteobacteria bacterium]